MLLTKYSEMKADARQSRADRSRNQTAEPLFTKDISQRLTKALKKATRQSLTAQEKRALNKSSPGIVA